MIVKVKWGGGGKKYILWVGEGIVTGELTYQVAPTVLHSNQKAWPYVCVNYV